MKAIINGKLIDTWNDEDQLICPFCGAAIEVDFETFSGNDWDTEEEFECPECGETFLGCRNVIAHYETYKIREGKTIYEDEE